MKPFPLLVFLFLAAGIYFSAGCAPERAPSPPTVTPFSSSVRTLPPATATVPPTATATTTSTPTVTLTPTPAASPTPFITPPAPGETVAIPVLMYHHLKFREANASETLRTWTVAPTEFAAQLDYFQGRGFHTVTFKQVVAFFEEGIPLPPNPILLTFDDGWLDHYTVAFPELRKRGMVGNFFVPTQYADVGGELLMNWEQVLEMDRAGMEFGGHTITHADLTGLNLGQAQFELSSSKAKMEAKLGHPTYALSYPFGAFNPYVVAETRSAGYRAALILCCGYAQSADALLTMPRIRISYDDTISDISGKLP